MTEVHTSSEYASLSDTLPVELQICSQWLAWSLEDHGEKKLRKVPYSPRSRQKASSTNPTTWTTFAEALATYQRGGFDGIGFVFTASDPFAGIDLDNCRDSATGRLEPWAAEIVRALDSYTEASPSGTGVHIIVKAKLPPGGHAKKIERGKVEMYDRGRYFTMTGEHVGGTPTGIEERHVEVENMHARIFGKQYAKQTNSKATGKKTAQDVDRVKEALQHIPADDYDTWLKVGMALHAAGDEHCNLWITWSQTCPEKFDREICHRKWASFSADRERGVTLATIIQLAKEHGWKPSSNGNGRAWARDEDAPAYEAACDFQPEPAPPPYEEEPAPETGDEEENARIIEEEREPEAEPSPAASALYPCPDILWQGRFLQVSNALNNRSWEVWAGTFAALSARAHRNIFFRYHRPLFGMSYTLLVSPTGLGKGVCPDTFRALVPPWYTVRDAPQSGPALSPILATVERDTKGHVVAVTPRPAALVMEEWTVLLKNAGIQNSTLVDTLNTLFHRVWPWNVSRSDRPHSGGGDLVIPNPTLTILATTTNSLLKEHVSERMIRAGFLNRYLTLPGSIGTWKFYNHDAAGVDTDCSAGLFADLTARPWGQGGNVWDAYTPEARTRIVEWGESLFEPIMLASDLPAEAMKRLHVYAHIIALVYAWGANAPFVEIPHVEASMAVITTAKAFLEELMTEEREPEVPKWKAYEIGLEQKVTAKVKAQPGITRRQVVHALAGTRATSSDISTLITRLLLAGTLVECAVGTRNKARRLYLPEDAPRG